MGSSVDLAFQVSYYAAAFLFIMGLKRMSSPVTAASGIKWAGVGMAVATLITFVYPDLHNYLLMTTAIFIGGVLAWWTGKKVAMTDMPQMIALYNGMGGGAAAAIAAVELLGGEAHGVVVTLLALLGGLIGAVSFSGSLIAFAKLEGWMKKPIRFAAQNGALPRGGGQDYRRIRCFAGGRVRGRRGSRIGVDPNATCRFTVHTSSVFPTCPYATFRNPCDCTVSCRPILRLGLPPREMGLRVRTGQREKCRIKS